MEFPRLVYKSASLYQLAENEVEHKKLLQEGWFASVSEALEVKTIKPVIEKELTEEEIKTLPPTYEELVVKAKEIGIKGWHLMRPDTLREAIERKLEA